MDKLPIKITILDANNEDGIAKQLGIGNRTRYRDNKKHLVFFKRIDPQKINQYQIEGVKVS